MCRFDEVADLTEADVRSLRIIRCMVPRLNADDLETHHALYLSDSRFSDLLLSDARICCALIVAGARLDNEIGPTFTGDRLSTSSAIFNQTRVKGA
jgi:hypothetical protein